VDVESFHAVNQSPLIPLGHGGSAACGEGDDVVRGDYYDELALDCELFRDGAVAYASVRPDRHGVVTLRARCAWARDAPCRGVATLVWGPVPAPPAQAPFAAAVGTPRPRGCRAASKRRLIASGRFTLRAGRVNRVRLGLGSRARRNLAHAGCLAVRADLRYREPGGRQHEMTRTLALRAPRRR
jgi:hypothetical protein